MSEHTEIADQDLVHHAFMRDSELRVGSNHGKTSLTATPLFQSWIDSNLPTAEIEAIEELAVKVFESEDKAHRWLQRPNLATYKRPPISLLGFKDGYAHVHSLLMRIEHGNLA